MKLRKTALAASAFMAGAFLAIGAPLSASAHISVEPSSTAAGSSAVLTFALPHGCEGSATTAISIGIPEGITSVTPTVKPDWSVSEVEVDLAAPLADGHGNSITSRTGQVVYTAEVPLDDGLRDTFALSITLPEDAAGQSLSFPIVQTCTEGQTDWNEVTQAGAAEPEHPAPAIVVTEPTADAHAAADAHDAADTADAAGTAETPGDVLARVLGIGGLVLGAIGIVLAVTARRATTR